MAKQNRDKGLAPPVVKRKRPGRPMQDLRGRRFGYLVAIRLVPKSETGTISKWLFRCDCGKERIWESSHVTHSSRRYRSCGCGGSRVPPPHKYPERHVGMRYGNVVIMDYLHVDDRGHHHYAYLCDCGTEGQITLAEMNSSSYVSCQYCKEYGKYWYRVPED